MVDVNRHKFFLVQILKDIYSDIELSSYLGFKGGTALMFFYDLPRFSVDLDFNLLEIGRQESVKSNPTMLYRFFNRTTMISFE